MNIILKPEKCTEGSTGNNKKGREKQTRNFYTVDDL